MKARARESWLVLCLTQSILGEDEGWGPGGLGKLSIPPWYLLLKPCLTLEVCFLSVGKMP